MAAIAVVGAAGFVGGNLVKALVSDGHRVKGIDLVPPDGATRLAPVMDKKRDLEFEYVWKSALDLAEDDIDDVDVVIYLAAQADVPLGISSPTFTFQQNVMSVVHYMDLLTRPGIEPPRTIYMSSESVYGVVPKEFQPIREDAPLNPTNAYAVSKMCAEAVVRAYAAQFNLNATVLRSTTLFGPNSRTKQVVPIFIRQALQGKDITVEGDGSQSRDFNYVGNMIRGIYLALERDIPGTFNIGSGREVSIKELAEKVIETVRGLGVETESKVVFGPWRPGEQGVQLSVSIDKARDLLGYTPLLTLEEGLHETVRWWAKHI